MSYTFLNASGTPLTAASNEVSGAHQPIVQINSALGALPVTFSGNTSVSGTIGASIIGTVPVTGSIAVLQGSNPWIVGNSSVQTIQGTTPWVVGSVIATIQGSVAAILPGGSSMIAVLQAPSIVGTYTEDSAHTSGDRGLFVMQVRNDNMSSITSADGDYSPTVVGPAGEVITANSPITKWIQGQSSVMYTTSVQVIAPQGASVFTYITGMQIANDSPNFSRVRITGGLGSVLAWTVAPASGGSNIVFANPIKTGENSGVSASISGVSSVYISMQGFISKT